MNATIEAMTFFSQASNSETSPQVQTQAGRARKLMWAGRILSGIAVLFLAFDAGVKLVAPQLAAQASPELGWPASVLPGIGIVQLICLVVYMIPRSAPVGAVLWTGYLGGAIASHVRVGNPAFNVIFPIFVAMLLWAGLWLRDRRIAALLVPGSKFNGATGFSGDRHA